MDNVKIPYAGIGSRVTPLPFIRCFRTIGEELSYSGYILRSGGADGADKAFEQGCDDAGGKKKYIYLGENLMVVIQIFMIYLILI